MPATRRRLFRIPFTCNLDPLWWACALLVAVATSWVALQVWQRANPSTQDYQSLIEKYASETGLSESLIEAVILTESSGDPDAHSSADARGLMQITSITHREVIRVFDLPEAEDEALYDPEYNIAIGTRYLSHMHKRFDGDTRLALAAYHMGPTDLRKLINAHPTFNTDQILALDGEDEVGPKTRAYVENVMRRINEAQ